jgi:hypothetical protein
LGNGQFAVSFLKLGVPLEEIVRGVKAGRPAEMGHLPAPGVVREGESLEVELVKDGPARMYDRLRFWSGRK